MDGQKKRKEKREEKRKPCRMGQKGIKDRAENVQRRKKSEQAEGGCRE